MVTQFHLLAGFPSAPGPVAAFLLETPTTAYHHEAR